MLVLYLDFQTLMCLNLPAFVDLHEAVSSCLMFSKKKFLQVVCLDKVKLWNDFQSQLTELGFIYLHKCIQGLNTNVHITISF